MSISSRYYIGSYKKAVEKKLSLELLFYYKLKCSVGRVKLYTDNYLSELTFHTNLPKSTIHRNVQRLVKCGFIEIKEDLKERTYYSIISPEKVNKLLGVFIKYDKCKKTSYNTGFIPKRYQYGFVTILNEKKNESISKILSLELKDLKRRQNYIKDRNRFKTSGIVQSLLRQRLYRELQLKGTMYRVPADIIISNKTTASLLGYISQSQGNIITHKLVTNKKAINIDTPPIKEVKRGISIFDFYESFDSNKYYYCQRTRSVYTRECSHIFLS